MPLLDPTGMPRTQPSVPEGSRMGPNNTLLGPDGQPLTGGVVIERDLGARIPIDSDKLGSRP